MYPYIPIYVPQARVERFGVEGLGFQAGALKV